ncbi:hypothetical protein N7G274_002889 [Stereocaulon virgatum]|uniref:Uncharacterized protein n=1 Tax=Stereocaulon virgatum TaxID=373712 RepID=A0ABR4AFC9_9LECA
MHISNVLPTASRQPQSTWHRLRDTPTPHSNPKLACNLSHAVMLQSHERRLTQDLLIRNRLGRMWRYLSGSLSLSLPLPRSPVGAKANRTAPKHLTFRSPKPLGLIAKISPYGVPNN